MLFKRTRLAAMLAAVQQCAAVAVPVPDVVINTGSSSSLVKRKDWESPVYNYLYQFPLPIPKVKTPKFSVTNPVTNKPIDYYEVNILPFKQRVYPNLGEASLIGYDGISPGPTFMMEKGREAVVRFINNSTMANAVHLHGSYSRAPWDGWAEDVTLPTQFKDYYYPNSQNARMLWYHDHAVDHTAENAYFGQAGAYILHDAAEDALGLPSGYGTFDIPMVLSAKQYNKDGTLFSPAGVVDNLFGDVIHVNGQPWPYLNVQPRKYRFRFLNAAISRTFMLYLQAATGSTAKIPFQVIATDAGLTTGPISTDGLYISMAERYEIVVDFTNYKGQNVTLRNNNDFSPDTPYLHTDKVLQFVVSGAAVTDTSKVPSTLRSVPFPPPVSDTATPNHHYLFERQNGGWRINGVAFSEVDKRVLAKVPRGTVEVWELQNGAGGWSHPIHVHLVDFKVLSRTGGNLKRGVQPYEAAGLKDVVWLGPGETVRVEAHYAPWDGVYMFHCHNLIHEDHEMMAAFNVTALTDLGYAETSFADPMEARWRAQAATPDLLTQAAITAKIQMMAELQPYNNVDEVLNRLDQYWKTHTSAPPVRRQVEGILAS